MTTLAAVPAAGHHTLAEARDLISSPAVEVVSTDVFDTLVWRRVTEPIDAFELVGRRLERAGALAPGLTPAGFSNIRRMAEFRVRERFLEQRGTTEIRLAEIYDAIPDWVFGAGTREQGIEEELDTEREIVVPDLDVLDLLGAAAEHGKTVVAVSDTYFSSDHLRRLLGQAALARLSFRHVLTSSDHRENKSGKLFDVLLGVTGVQPERIVHLGDNEAADVDAPAERGIRTVMLERRSSELQRLLGREAGYRGAAIRLVAAEEKLGRPEGPDFGLSALRAKMEHRAELAQSPTALRPFWRYGAQVYGPVLAGFAEWVHERAADVGASKVFCLMREGAFLADLIRQASAGAGVAVDVDVLWANRDLCARAAIGDASREEIEHFLMRRTPPTVADVCRRVGAQVTDLPDLAGHAETSVEDPIMREVLLDALSADGPARERIVSGARALRDRLVRYVESVAGDADPLVLVDVGWGATIQRKLMAALEQAGKPRRVVGLYLATHEYATSTVQAGGEVYGFLANCGEPAPVVKTALRSPEIIEQICMPAHGTQTDIDADLRPVLAPDPPLTLQAVEAEALRRGALAFQREYLRYQARLPAKVTPLAWAADALAAILIRSIAAPTEEEAALFGRWMHDEGQTSSHSAAMVDEGWAERVRHLSPQQLGELPMNDIYWPWGLARRHDAELGDLAAAASAGLIDWEATSTPLESGTMTIEAVAGVGLEGATRYHAVPRRNRHGLSFVSTSVIAGSVERLHIRLGERPLTLRMDWLALRLWHQGESEPLVVRMSDPAQFDALGRVNVLLLAPNVFVGMGSQSLLVVEPARFTPRVVFRADVELAFAGLPTPHMLPGPGSAHAMASAEARVRQIESSALWRASAPVRAVRRRLR